MRCLRRPPLKVCAGCGHFPTFAGLREASLALKPARAVLLEPAYLGRGRCGYRLRPARPFQLRRWPAATLKNRRLARRLCTLSKHTKCVRVASPCREGAAPETIQIEITDAMMAAGLRQWYMERKFEHDWQVIARIYAAMRKAEI
jgi:hypothetical protein